MPRREIYCGRAYPFSRENGGPVSNPPDSPLIKRQATWEALGLFIPGTRCLPFDEGSFTTRYTKKKGIAGILLAPETKVSLTHVFNVHCGRVGGGGTSPEALRRAKRKARLNH